MGKIRDHETSLPLWAANVKWFRSIPAGLGSGRLSLEQVTGLTIRAVRQHLLLCYSRCKIFARAAKEVSRCLYLQR